MIAASTRLQPTIYGFAKYDIAAPLDAAIPGGSSSVNISPGIKITGGSSSVSITVNPPAPNVRMTGGTSTFSFTQPPRLNIAGGESVFYAYGTKQGATLNLAMSGGDSTVTVLEAAPLPFHPAAVTWAVNLDTGAVTRYTNYGFTRFAFDPNTQTMYGLAADGIYTLDTGETDDNTPIYAKLETGLTTFDTPLKKRVPWAWVNASGEHTAMTIEADSEAYTYNCGNPSPDVLTNRRIQIGKGLFGNNWRVTISNQTEAMAVDSIILSPIIIQRH